MLAQKLSVAREIASVSSIGNKNNGYYQIGENDITWACCHLIQLCGPDIYGFKTGANENLPMLPAKFELYPKQTKTN